MAKDRGKEGWSDASDGGVADGRDPCDTPPTVVKVKKLALASMHVDVCNAEENANPNSNHSPGASNGGVSSARSTRSSGKEPAPLTPRNGSELLQLLTPRGGSGGGGGAGGGGGGGRGCGGGKSASTTPRGGSGGAHRDERTPRGGGEKRVASSSSSARQEKAVHEGWSVKRVASSPRERAKGGAEEELNVILKACAGQGDDELRERVGSAVMAIQGEIWKLKDAERRARRKERTVRGREEMLRGLLDDTTSEIYALTEENEYLTLQLNSSSPPSSSPLSAATAPSSHKHTQPSTHASSSSSSSLARRGFLFISLALVLCAAGTIGRLTCPLPPPPPPPCARCPALPPPCPSCPTPTPPPPQTCPKCDYESPPEGSHAASCPVCPHCPKCEGSEGAGGSADCLMMTQSLSMCANQVSGMQLEVQRLEKALKRCAKDSDHAIAVALASGDAANLCDVVRSERDAAVAERESAHDSLKHEMDKVRQLEEILESSTRAGVKLGLGRSPSMGGVLSNADEEVGRLGGGGEVLWYEEGGVWKQASLDEVEVNV